MKKETDDQIITKLEKVIETGHYYDFQTIEEISQYLGVSMTDLNNFTGIKEYKAFPSWRVELRMALAAHLIERNPTTQICEIASRVGILDKSNFRKQFMLSKGVTPLKYREKIKATQKWKKSISVALKKIFMRIPY